MGNFEKLSVVVIIVIIAGIIGVAIDTFNGSHDSKSISSMPDDERLDVQYVTGGALTPPILLEVPWGRAKKAVVILIGGDENHPDEVEAISITRGYGSTYSEYLNMREAFRIKEEFAGRPRLFPVR